MTPLQMIRHDKHLSLRDAAKLIGISNCYLSQIETEQRRIPEKLLWRIAEGYKMPVATLRAAMAQLNTEYILAAFEVACETNKHLIGMPIPKDLPLEVKGFALELLGYPLHKLVLAK